MEKRIKLPKKLKIGCVVYKVIYPYIFTNDNYIGLHWSSRSNILISNKYNEKHRGNSKILETFIHEMLHAVDFIYLNTIFNEEEIDNMGIMLTDVLVRNKNLNFDKDSIPKSIMIGPYYFKIKYPHKDIDNPEATYIIHAESCDIYLSKVDDGFDVNMTIIKSNLLISIFHVIFNCCKINDRDPRTPDIIEVFSRGILQVLLDNKLCTLINNQRSLLRV